MSQHVPKAVWLFQENYNQKAQIDLAIKLKNLIFVWLLNWEN